jgi:hypothetical protein
MQKGHAAWTRRMDTQHGHAAWTRTYSMDKGPALHTWPCSMDIRVMQQGHGIQNGHGHEK